MSNVDIKIKPLQTYPLKDSFGNYIGYEYPSDKEMMDKINELSEKINTIIDVLQNRKHVYCTNCKWFNITEDDVPTCKYETECDICDPEDSRPYEDRPHYEKHLVNLHVQKIYKYVPEIELEEIQE